MTYRAGDIFLVSGQGFFSKGIRFFTRDRGEAETRATHGGVIVSDGDANTATVVEALGVGVVLRPFSEGPGKELHAVYRPINISPEAIKEGIVFAHKNVGRKYGWLKIGAQVLDWAIPFRPGGHQPYVFRRLAGYDRFPFCTFLVDGVIRTELMHRAMAEFGPMMVKADICPFGVEQNCCTPDDIDDFVELHPDIYEVVSPWGRLVDSGA